MTKIPAVEAAKPVDTTTPSPSRPADATPLADLAPHLPDPERPFWWFSTTPIAHKKISAGRPMLKPCGSRLPADADYWCHEGAAEWVKVDRNIYPKPQPKKQVKRQKKARNPR